MSATPASLIPPVANAALESALRARLANARPHGGSFGELEPLAVRLGLIANSLRPAVGGARLVVFAGDHGFAAGAESAEEPTSKAIDALAKGPSTLAALAHAAGVSIDLVDCGITSATESAERIVVRKVAFGTRDLRAGPAMSVAQAHAALEAGLELGDRHADFAAACAGIGRGAAASAALVLAALSDAEPWAFFDAPGGRPVQVDDALASACARAKRHADPLEALAEVGGFETATLVGWMLALASRRRLVVVDGLPACAALLVATRIAPAVADYCMFARSRSGGALDRALALFGVGSLVELGLEAPDGTGAVLAWPLIRSAAVLLGAART